jgi:hypothetical protein
MQQNLESSLDHALGRRGQRVLLTWQRAHVVALTPHAGPEAASEPVTAGEHV